MEVKVIQATKRTSYPSPQQQRDKLRVAAYARVSTDDPAQEESYEAQIDYYTKLRNYR